MLSYNSLQMFTLVLMLTMGGLNLCMANPVNKGDEFAINKDPPTKRLFNMTSSKESVVLETERVVEGSMGDKPETGAVYIKEEETKMKASWETAKYV